MLCGRYPNSFCALVRFEVEFLTSDQAHVHSRYSAALSPHHDRVDLHVGEMISMRGEDIDLRGSSWRHDPQSREMRRNLAKVLQIAGDDCRAYLPCGQGDQQIIHRAESIIESRAVTVKRAE
jgi:hypothetical protein